MVYDMNDQTPRPLVSRPGGTGMATFKTLSKLIHVRWAH